jgi:hypothetical protein
MPRVEVFFEEFAPGTDTVTVYRMVNGREAEVQGALRAPTAGSLTRLDFGAPFNVPLTYRAQMFDVAGTDLGFTDASTLGASFDGLLPGDDTYPGEDTFPDEFVAGAGLMSDETWLHNPLDPRGGVRVQLAATTGNVLSRPVPATISRPLGRRLGVVLAEPRGGVQGLQFDVYTYDLESADKLQALVGSDANTTVPVVCVRLGGVDQRLRIPQPFHMSVFDPVEVDLTVQFGGETLLTQMVGDEVEPPTPGLFIPLLTAADINAYFQTAADVNASALAAYTINRRYDLAGYATA